MMANIVAGLGVLVALIGIIVMSAPQLSREFAGSMRSRKALYAAVAVRILIGAFFVAASDGCAWPLAVGSVGVAILLAGFAGLFIGVARLEAIMDRFQALSDGAWRVWAGVAVAFGAFVVYAAI